MRMPTADAPPAILATAVVPWTERLEFDEARFRRQVHTIARTLTKHIYIFGTAGEGHAVNEQQFDQISQAFWLSAQEAGVSPMVGLISLSLPTIIARMCLPKPVSTTIATCPTTNAVIATKPKKCSVRAD